MMGKMESPQQESLKNTLHQIDAQLAEESVSKEKVSTIGKALFEVSQVFQTIARG